MTDTTVPAITAADEGCWFAGASTRTADELNACVVLAAMHHGWAPDEAEALRTVAENVDGWCDDEGRDDAGDGHWLSEAGWDAMGYLNSVAPAGYGFEFDDGFYMRALCDVEGYDGDDCPHGDDCPNVDAS